MLKNILNLNDINGDILLHDKRERERVSTFHLFKLVGKITVTQKTPHHVVKQLSKHEMSGAKFIHE